MHLNTLKLSTLIINVAIALLASNSAFACKSVMGGCVPEPTNDTSSHMKSEIVNRVVAKPITAAKPAVAVMPAANTVASQNKTPVKRTNLASNNSGIMQAVSKAVLK